MAARREKARFLSPAILKSGEGPGDEVDHSCIKGFIIEVLTKFERIAFFLLILLFAKLDTKQRNVHAAVCAWLDS